MALETTIVSHGMPWPDNLETALAVEAVVRDAGAVPAAIAVIDGRIRVGLDRNELEQLAQAKDVLKLSSADIAYGLASGRTGATTVAATMIAAHLAGIGVFATGGIGGVHRGAETSFDVSADLTELSRTPVTVVCGRRQGAARPAQDAGGAGDAGRAGGRLPAATPSPPSGRATAASPPPSASTTPTAIAGFMRTRAELGQAGGMLVANPVPEADEIPAAEMAPVIEAAVADAAAKGISRQGGDAVPARRDLSPDRRAEPCHQHRAGEEQRPPGGRDRRGAGGGPAPRPRLTTTRGGGRNETLTHKTVAVSDGTALHYIETGDGRPLLLVPGWSQSAAEFVHQIDAFAKFARVFAIDMRGHGESAKPKNGYRVQRLAKDLYDVIVRLGLEEPDVLGHSMGSSVIWAYLSMFGDERPLGRLIIADQAPATVAQPDWDARTIADAGSAFADFGVLATFEKSVVATTDAEGTREIIRGMFTTAISEADLLWIAAENLKLPRRHAAELHHDHVSLDWRSEIPAIRNRTLVIGGDISIFSARSQQWIAEQIPGARVEIFSAADKGAHFMFFENPEKFNALVGDFLAH